MAGADHCFAHGELLEAFIVHEMQLFAVSIKEIAGARLERDAFDLFVGGKPRVIFIAAFEVFEFDLVLISKTSKRAEP